MKLWQAVLWIGVAVIVLGVLAVGAGGVSTPLTHTSIGPATNGTINISGTIDVGVGAPTGEAGPPQLDRSLAGPPTDVDGDGVYEDLNGNGRADFDDVVQYFRHLRNPAITEHVTAYDYNDNGRIDFADIVVLFGEV